MKLAAHVQPAGRPWTECIGSTVVACDCDCDGAGDVDASTRFAGLILSTSPEAVTSEKRPVELELSPLITALCPLSSGREWSPWMRTSWFSILKLRIKYIWQVSSTKYTVSPALYGDFTDRKY